MPARPLSLENTRVTCLTEMTGAKAAEARQVMIPKVNVDVPKKSLIIFLAAFAPSALVGLLFVALVNATWVFALIVFALCEMLAFFLFQRRTREGLQVRTFTELADKHSRPIHVVMIGGVQVDPTGGVPATIVASSVPVERDRDTEFMQGLGLADEPSAKTTRKSKKKKSKKSKNQPAKVDVFGVAR